MGITDDSPAGKKQEAKKAEQRVSPASLLFYVKQPSQYQSVRWLAGRRATSSGAMTQKRAHSDLFYLCARPLLASLGRTDCAYASGPPATCIAWVYVRFLSACLCRCMCAGMRSKEGSIEWDLVGEWEGEGEFVHSTHGAHFPPGPGGFPPPARAGPPRSQRGPAQRTRRKKRMGKEKE